MIKYKNLSYSITSKIRRSNNTRFILLTESGAYISIKVGEPKKVLKVIINGFTLTYDKN